MKQLAILAVVAGLFAAIAFLAPRFLQPQELEVMAEVTVPTHCDLRPGSCGLEAQGHSISIATAGELTPLKPVEITLTADSLVSARVDFEMIGMDMGDNHFNFLPKSEGEWVATVVLPVCSLGRNDWIAFFDLQFAGQGDAVLRVSYPFVIIGR